MGDIFGGLGFNKHSTASHVDLQIYSQVAFVRDFTVKLSNFGGPEISKEALAVRNTPMKNIKLSGLDLSF